MKKETYKTIHPTITEISIGDTFLLNNGRIAKIYSFGFGTSTIDNIYEFRMKIRDENNHYQFYKGQEIKNDGWYTFKLLYYRGDYSKSHPYDIKCKIPSLKDKIDLL